MLADQGLKRSTAAQIDEYRWIVRSDHAEELHRANSWKKTPWGGIEQQASRIVTEQLLVQRSPIVL